MSTNTCPEGIPCFECETGIMRNVQETYRTHLRGQGDVTIPDVPMLKCDKCSDLVCGHEGMQIIDDRLEKSRLVAYRN